MKNIHIGDVTIPLMDYATGRSAILGITKSGKTYTAKGIAEQLLEAGVGIVVFDAIGVWRHLKTSGAGDGYAVVVAGGAEPDIPLTPHSAAEIVRAAIRENIPLVIDLYDPRLSKADWRRIVQSCFRVLLYENKGIRHVFLEESAEFAPQKVMDGETYAEVEKLARMGGNASVGITFINQRAQELNKAVLELCDNIVLLRQRGSHAIDSLEKWLDRLSPDEAASIAKSMPMMTQGDCWVFSEHADKAVRTRSRRINSFHPDRRNPVMPEKLKTVSTFEFVGRMNQELAEIITKAKENDIVEVRKQLTAAHKEIGKLKTELMHVSSSRPQEQVSILTDEDRRLLKDVVSARMPEVLDNFEKLHAKTIECVRDTQKYLDTLAKKISSAHPQVGRTIVKDIGSTAKIRALPNVRRPAPEKNQGINRTQQRILDALAWLESIGNSNPSALQVGAVALIDATGGHFSNTVGPLSSAGLIERGNGTIALTEAGRAIAAPPEQPPSMDEYHAMLRQRVRNARSAGGKTVEMLDVIIARCGEQITAEEIGAAVNVDHTGGHFSNMIGPLGTLGLINRNRGIITPTEILFPPALQ